MSVSGDDSNDVLNHPIINMAKEVLVNFPCTVQLVEALLVTKLLSN